MKQTYPIKRFDYKIYIRVPVENEFGKYEAMDVDENGKVKKASIYLVFRSKSRCQRKCNEHNNYHGWSRAKRDSQLKKLGYGDNQTETEESN